MFSNTELLSLDNNCTWILIARKKATKVDNILTKNASYEYYTNQENMKSDIIEKFNCKILEQFAIDNKKPKTSEYRRYFH